MEDRQISVEQDGAVRRIWLDRADKRNAQSRQMLDQLAAAFDDAEADADTRVVLLGGKGAHFSAGHDLKQAQAERAEFTVEERWEYEARRYYAYALRIFDFPKPVIAQVQGGCMAAGFMIANVCDLIVAADDAFFADPVTHSMGAASVEVLIHPWVMGLRMAKEMLMTGGRVSAERAYQIGMVNRLVAAADLDEEAMKLAQSVASGPPFGMQLIKKSLNRSVEVQGLKSALSAHFDTHQLSHMTDEYARVTGGGLAGSIAKGAAVSKA